MTTIYKVVLNGSAYGIDIKNILWYRSNIEALGGYAGQFLVDSAQAIGESVQNHVWEAYMRFQMSENYTLQTIDVYPYSAAFTLDYSLPFSVAVNQQGSLSGSCLPLECCGNVRMNVAPALVEFPLFPAPRRGMVKIAPVMEADFDDAGRITTSGLLHLGTIGGALQAVLPWDFIDIDIPFVGWEVGVGIPLAFSPLRVRTWEFSTPEVIGGTTYARFIASADVASTTPAGVIGHAVSRRPEA
jgi:hypothetical protein